MNHQIHIPKPCHEDWNKMSQVERGRHCQKCAKTVHDVTNLSNQQVHLAYQENNQSLCIRIPAHRLSALPPTPAKTGWKYLAMASLMTFWMGVKKVFGDEPQEPRNSNVVSTKDSVDNKDSIINKMIVRGVILDSLNNSTPMPFAHIRILKEKVLLQDGISDLEGQFEINVTDSLSTNDTLTLEVEYIGYKKITKEFQPNDTLQIEIFLNELHVCMGREVVLEGRRVFQGIMTTGIMITPTGHRSIKRHLLDEYDTKTYHHDELERYNLGR